MKVMFIKVRNKIYMPILIIRKGKKVYQRTRITIAYTHSNTTQNNNCYATKNKNCIGYNSNAGSLGKWAMLG